MDYQENILDLFKSAFKRDKVKYIKDFLVGWAYQDRRTSTYEDGLPQDFFVYPGPKEIEKWFNWMSNPESAIGYLPKDKVHELIGLAEAHDKKLFEELGLKFDEEKYREIVGRKNAQDYIFTHLYPVPERYEPKVVMDFGAGFGRQANLWTQKNPEMTFVGVDGIPLSYCLQHLYYSKLNIEFQDYIVSPDNFKFTKESKGLFHIPTWRLDLLPDNHFDMILCVHVLPELSGKLVKYVVDQFKRVLKPGGAIYLRDHEEVWKPGFKFNIYEHLIGEGFVQEYKAHIIMKEDLADCPRIWRKADPKVLESHKRSGDQKVDQLIRDVDYLSGGTLRKVYRKLKGK